MVTIYFGLDLDIAKVDGSARYIMIIYTAIFVAVEVIFELYRRCKLHKGKGRVMISLNCFNPLSYKILTVLITLYCVISEIN